MITHVMFDHVLADMQQNQWLFNIAKWKHNRHLQYTPYTSGDFLNGFRKSPWTPQKYEQEFKNSLCKGSFLGSFLSEFVF